MSDPTHNIILMWWGLLANIPTGWKLCDGNNNTPDLRNRFLFGAGDMQAPDDTGDYHDHDHSFTSNTHFHTLPLDAAVLSGANYSWITGHEPIVGTTDNTAVLPPYKAVYFIKKD